MAFVINVSKYHYQNKTETRACSKASRRITSPKLIVQSLGQRKSSKRRSVNKKMVAKLLKIKGEMKEISKEQNSIKEGQRQVKEKVEAIESECETLRRETMIIMRQSASTRLRLAFLFEILKARESNDFAKAAKLTHALRELIAKQNQINGQYLGPKARTTSDE